jgi:hypothetical protein
MLRSDEAKAAAERAGVSLNIPDEGVSHEALDIMIERAKVRQRREDVINRGPQGMLAGAAGFGTEIGAGLLDPIGFGLNFVPVVGQTTRVGMMASRRGRSRARWARPWSSRPWATSRPWRARTTASGTRR